MDKDQIKESSKGKWPGIYQHFGIDVGAGKHQPCPLCGGEDRFRFSDERLNGDYFCNGCGAGDGFTMLMKFLKCSFKDVLIKVSEITGTIKMTVQEKPKIDPRIELNKVWKSSTILTGIDPVSKYLQSRRLVLTPENVRYCPSCYESETKKEMPALLSMFYNSAGKPITIQRLFLNGINKADYLRACRKTMTPTESMNGGSVRLFNPGGMFEKDVLGIAEGVETAIAATQISNIATWACLSSTLLADWEPPGEIRKFVIFADNDANFTGQKVAYALANRLYLKEYLVSVELPPLGDWADTLLNQIDR